MIDMTAPFRANPQSQRGGVNTASRNRASAAGGVAKARRRASGRKSKKARRPSGLGSGPSPTSFPTKHTIVMSSDVRALAFSPDSQWLAAGSHTGPIWLLNAKTGDQKRVLSGHTA